MNLRQIDNVTFNIGETIVAACVTPAGARVMLLSSGQVVRCNADGGGFGFLFDVAPAFIYKDPDRKVVAQCSIYALDNIVVLVNDYSRHGYVHYPGKYNKLPIERGSYHADITQYPIALFKNDEGTPYLIYGVDWNHVQIMDLDTQQILTAAKTLIKENAEEKQSAPNSEAPNENRPRPAPYDYFYGGLLLSPDKKNFLSKGWVWGSVDWYNVYNVADFMSNSRIKDKYVCYGEHMNRAACWVDNNTVAVAYHPFAEGDDDSTKDDPLELRLYDTRGEEVVMTRRIVIGGELVMPEDIFYSKTYDVLIIAYPDRITIVRRSNGEVVLRDDSFKPCNFYTDMELFLSFAGQSVSVYGLDNK